MNINTLPSYPYTYAAATERTTRKKRGVADTSKRWPDGVIVSRGRAF